MTAKTQQDLCLDAVSVVTVALEDTGQPLGYQVGRVLDEVLLDVPSHAVEAVGQLVGWVAVIAAQALKQWEADTGYSPAAWLEAQSIHAQTSPPTTQE